MSTKKFSTLTDRLKHIREIHGIKPAEFARRLGISRAYVSDLESGKKTKISDQLAHSIAYKFGINPDWLLSGAGEMFQLRSAIPSMPVARHFPADHVRVPLYNVKVSAGPGEIPVDESVREWLPLKLAWLKAELRAGIANLLLMPVEGDSMDPVIRKGDIVLVDRAEDRVRDDDIYVIRREGFLSVKRLQLRPGGKLQIISENRSYPEYTVDLSRPDDFSVIGRVIWYGRNL